MANTSELNRIETILSSEYCRRHGYLDLRKQFPDLAKLTILETKPDVLAISGSTLLIAEITCSGFLGYRNRNFHLGATRKLAEIFLKLSILENNAAQVLKTVNSWNSEFSFSKLKTCMIVPEGSQFIQALGWRSLALKQKLLTLHEVPLSRGEKRNLTAALNRASAEIKK